MFAHMQGNHNFGTTSHCRVPLSQRANQQRITPDIQTGCISCASGDGRFGGPVWWNTPLDDDGDKEEDNRTTWQRVGAEGGDNGNAGGAGRDDGDDGDGRLGPSAPGSSGAGRKRGAEELDDDDEDDMPEEVKRRLQALQGGLD